MCANYARCLPGKDDLAWEFCSIRSGGPVLLLLSLCLLLFAGGLPAAESSIRIQWSEVAGARGYGVQWEPVDSTGSVSGERQVQATSIELRLMPGAYRIRVSALNRFGKAAGWSEWIDFRLEDTAKKQTLDLNRAEAERKALEPPPRKVMPVPGWHRGIPGLVQIETGRSYGWAYPALITGLGAYAYTQKRMGDRIAADSRNDPDLLVTASFLYPGLTPFFWQNRIHQRHMYDLAQQNQRMAGYAIVSVLVAHALDVIRIDLPRPGTALLIGDGQVALQFSF